MAVPLPRHPPQGVPAQFALTLLQEISATGDDPGHLLARLGLPFTFAQLAAGRVQVISDHHFVLLYGECITVLSAHANRERGLPPMSKDEVDMLCYCVITCTTLAEVIERASRFCAMLDHRAADLSLVIDADEAVFHMATQRLRHSVSGLLTDLNGLSFYHRLFAWLIGEAIPVQGYDVYAEAPADRATLERFFQQPIRFACPDNNFRFPAHQLARPVVRSYQRLVERLSVFPFDHLREPRDGAQFADTVEHIIATRLGRQQSMPSLEQFARFFCISRATLQRRLREEGVTLDAIKQRLRLKLAEELLQPGARLKVSDVALRLGFSDVRSFRRAFIEWTGKSPDAWRRGPAARQEGNRSGIIPQPRSGGGR
ncbi:MAG: AraC family transcriptional regulator ligand-binding domain-containing protein [Gammaproteobacteria bacterium]|jgi:AraC-like DNA-binding protein|nr:AraC family transcriptional regulator ligand-binding domain-containing protein [Gammaproteobacteria bacterium]MBP6050199.1 AraC family transcriptional regulator ligand-binding domain-containing protein [Pseudomonadales bacterium]MBK6583880.1 AraC family transcriptional regulator ligand-binding domain-containing protein [Gammaproteobacteria bacterium]MBK7169781.1 AraC family transcriptional regulator ligand-binding domain-containing protein [Gammaproteobacteria bacterium]MBK7522215.1 AraC fam